MAAPTDSKNRAAVTTETTVITDTTRFFRLADDGADWEYWEGATLRAYFDTKKFRERFDVAASQATLTVTVNGGVLPTGVENELAKKIELYQNPGGKKLLYPDDFTFLSSVITLNAGVVLPVAATYELIFTI